MGNVHRKPRTVPLPAPAKPVANTRPHVKQTTFSKSDLDKMALSFWSEARNADANNDRRVSKKEIDGFTARPTAVRTQMKKVLQGALDAKGLNVSVRTGDLYAYAKSLLPELRAAADQNGNQDKKLTSRELQGVSAPARALFEFGKALANRKA